ncbi:MAG: DUF4203 domain-containing protein [Acidobacteria bacterium]|nr:DUF4203 domain-containing protein [Acidobacteriota bacterium]
MTLMLPPSYELPFAILLVLGGALSCLAGYRLFKIVLATFGFFLGALLVSSTMGMSSTTGMVAGAIVGGIVGVLILAFAYFIGNALVGAGLGAAVAHIGWGVMRGGDPPVALVIVLTIVGALVALVLRRYVIIVGTAFGGAWTAILGGLAIAGDRSAMKAAASGDVWILYPIPPAPGRGWMSIAWVALGFIGTAVQLSATGRKR